MHVLSKQCFRAVRHINVDFLCVYIQHTVHTMNGYFPESLNIPCNTAVFIGYFAWLDLFVPDLWCLLSADIKSFHLCICLLIMFRGAVRSSTSAVTHETAAVVVRLLLLLVPEEQKEKSVMCLNSSLMP